MAIQRDEKTPIEQKKAYAVSRIKAFLAQLEEADAPLDIEGSLYCIKIVADTVYKEVHKINGRQYGG